LVLGVGDSGVQRQYTGTAGRIENAQVAVFVSYSTAAGYTLTDWETYLLAFWTDDTDRVAAAGVPEGTGFATKPQLAARMVARALDAGVSAGWVAGGEVYGNDPALCAGLEARGMGYVLAVACDHPVVTAAGKQRADMLVERLPGRADGHPVGVCGVADDAAEAAAGPAAARARHDRRRAGCKRRRPAPRW
jgi:hypothetical protein